VEQNLSLSSISEFEPLVVAARDGDGKAFALLVQPCLSSCLAAAVVITGSSQDGSDAMQEALIAAWRGLGSLRDPAAFPSWFRKLVVRAAMKAARRRRGIRVTEMVLEAAPLHRADDSFDRMLEIRVLDRAFDRLDPKDRMVLALRYASGLSTEEIAGTLSIPEGTVKSRVHSAMQRLRAAYAAEERR
jgi:RNA polymerase sigma factor (sigma-70 family)